MRAVLCVGNLKQAALYFDRVVPLVFTMMRGTGDDIVFHCAEQVPSRVLFDVMLGERNVPESRYYDLFARLWEPWVAYIEASGDIVAEAARTAGLEFFEEHGEGPFYRDHDYGRFSAEVLSAAYLNNAADLQHGSIRDHVARFARGFGLECTDALLTQTAPVTVTGDVRMTTSQFSRSPVSAWWMWMR